MTFVLLVTAESSELRRRSATLSDSFAVVAGHSLKEALELFEENHDKLQVVIADLKMPNDDALTLLKAIRDQDDLVTRVALGTHDEERCLRAVNEADVFRVVPPGAPDKEFRQCVQEAAEYHQTRTSEHEILENTLKESVRSLTEILQLTNPLALARSRHLKNYALQIGELLKAPEPWTLEMAAQLSQLGCVTVPEFVLKKFYSGDELTIQEKTMIGKFPDISRRLIQRIPRLRKVADVLALLPRKIDAGRFEQKDVVVIHAAILKTAMMFDVLRTRGFSREEAITNLREAATGIPKSILDVLDQVEMLKQEMIIRDIFVEELKNGMIIDEDVKTNEGVLVVSKGLYVRETLRNRLQNFAKEGSIKPLLRVLIPY